MTVGADIGQRKGKTMDEPKPSELRPIQGFKKPFWNATIKGDIITFKFIPRDDEDNEKRYEYAQRFLPEHIREGKIDEKHR